MLWKFSEPHFSVSYSVRLQLTIPFKQKDRILIVWLNYQLAKIFLHTLKIELESFYYVMRVSHVIFSYFAGAETFLLKHREQSKDYIKS